MDPKKNYGQKIVACFKGLKLPVKILIPAIAAILLIVIVFGTALSREGGISAVSESSLEKVLEISELSTVEYIYNAIAECKDEETVKYYVAYEGTVTAGIDFEQITFDIDRLEKTVTIIVPPVQIQECNVDETSMEFIFTKSKYETETVTAEAYKLCKEDLESAKQNDELILESAKENAVSAIKALFDPWIETADPEYQVEIVYGG